MLSRFGFNEFIAHDDSTFDLVILKYAILHVEKLGLPTPPQPIFPEFQSAMSHCIFLYCTRPVCKDSMFCANHKKINFDTISLAAKPLATACSTSSSDTRIPNWADFIHPISPASIGMTDIYPIKTSADPGDIKLGSVKLEFSINEISRAKLQGALNPLYIVKTRGDFNTKSTISHNYSLDCYLKPLELVYGETQPFNNLIYVTEFGMFDIYNLDCFYEYYALNVKFAILRDRKIEELKWRGESIMLREEMTLSYTRDITKLHKLFEYKVGKMQKQLDILTSITGVTQSQMIDGYVRALYDYDKSHELTNDEFDKHKYEELHFYLNARDAWFESVKHDESLLHVWESLPSYEKRYFDNRPVSYSVSHDYTCESCKRWLNSTDIENIGLSRNNPVLRAINRIYSELDMPELKHLPDEWFENETVLKLRTMLSTRIKVEVDNTKLIAWERIFDFTVEEKDEWARMKLLLAPFNLIPPTLKGTSIVCKAWKESAMDVICGLIR